MNPTIYRYPLDPTGLSPDNKVVNEIHQLNTRAVRCVAPTYGGFFSESLIVKNAVNDQPLIRGTDYIVAELFEFPTGRYGKEINGIIVIKNKAITATSITYQALGGDYSYSMDAIIAMIESLELDDRPVEWGNIIGRPPSFDPASHLHDVGDIYGFEYVVHSLERLRTAVLLGDVASHDEIYAYIDNWGEELNDAINAVTNRLMAHENDRNNPHAVTKAQVGLSVVENYGIATKVEAEVGASNVKYMTPLRTMETMTLNAITPFNNHKNDKNNPHAVTKAQVGLGSVDNYPTATADEALTGTLNNRFVTPLQLRTSITQLAIRPMDAHIADKANPHAVTKAQVGLSNVQNYGMSNNSQATVGTDNASYMTPLRVKEAIAAQVGNSYFAHAANLSNPHAVTKAQVGLGNVQNYGMSSNPQAVAGTDNATYMTPLRVKEAITSQVGTSYFAHAANVSNPHNTTKAQVGLSVVENYGIATQAEATAGSSNVKYMTPLRVKEAITAQAGTALNNHINNKSNPHAVTKAQVGLGSVENYGIATQAQAEAGAAGNVYMTPQRVAQAISSQAGVALSNHSNNKSNPHAVTKAQVGLGSVENYGIATQAEAAAATNNAKYMTPLRTRESTNAAVNSGLYDGRFITRDINADGSIHVRPDLGTAYIWLNGSWRMFWPPQWQ